MIHIIFENYLWKVKNMTKQTKIILSVLISCTMLLAIAIPSFAQSYNFNLISPPYLTNDNIDSDSFFTEFTPLFESMSIGVPIYFETDDDYIQRVYFLRPDEYNLNVGFTVYSPELDPNPLDIVALGVDFEKKSVYDGFLSLDDLNVDIQCYVPDLYADLLRSFFPSSIFPSYTDNPFTDIMTQIIEALDVPIFGTFSLWDMVTTLCGIFAVIWLLKLLAGG